MKAGTSCRFFTSIFFHEQGQRGGVAVQEILLTHRSDLAVAKEAGQTERTQSFLDVAGVVVRHSEQMLAASVATAQAAAVNGLACQLLLCLAEQRLEILRAGGGVAALKLHRLACPRKRAHRQCAG